MAIKYVDLYNGNDANDGSTWALAKKTLAAISQASLSAGDEVRISKTPTPTLIGNATWVKYSTTIVTETPLTKSIEPCVGNTWTAITGTTMGTTTYRKYGANAQTFIITAAVTGKLAYKALPAQLDLSAFAFLSLFVTQTSGTLLNFANSGLSVALCSDNAGNTVVDSFPLDAVTIASSIHPMLLAKGGAMGATINSIALYRTTAVAANITISLNNIIAANSALNHLTIIGRSTNPYTRRYAVMSIIDSTITVDNCAHNNGASGGYCESSETNIPFYGLYGVREYTTAANTVINNLTTEEVIYKFGFDPATDLQDGETWYDGYNCLGIFITQLGSLTKVERVGICRYNIGVRNYGGEATILENSIAICCRTGIMSYPMGIYINVMSLNSGGYGLNIVGGSARFIDLIIENSGGSSTGSVTHYGIFTDNASGGGNNYFDGLIIDQYHLQSYVIQISLNFGGGNVFVNCQFKITASVYSINSYGNTFINCTDLGVNFNTGKGTKIRNSNVYSSDCEIYNHNGVEGVHLVVTDKLYGMQYLDNVAFGSTLGIWEIVFGRPVLATNIFAKGLVRTKLAYQFFRVAEVAVEANVQTSISLWVKRTNQSGRPIPNSPSATGTKGSALVIRALNSPAVDADIIQEFADGLFNWSLYGLVFTPDRTGVVALEIWAYYDDVHYLQFSTLNVAT